MTKAVLLIAIGAVLVLFSLQVPGLSFSPPSIIAKDCSKHDASNYPHGGMGGMGAVHDDVC